MFNMDKLFGGPIGPDQSGKFKISMLGLAMKDDSGSFVAYNREAGEMTDVMDMTFDGMDGAIFRLPVTEVEEGDLISHGKDLLYVEEVNGNRVSALNPFTSKVETVVPKGNLFGFKFFIKVVSLFDQMLGGFGEPDPKNPMKSVMPFMMMSMMSGNGGKDEYGRAKQSNGFESMLPMLMLPQLMGGKEEGAAFDIQSILPFMLMSGMNGGQGNGNNMMQMLMMTQLLGTQGEGGGLFGSLTTKKTKTKSSRRQSAQQPKETSTPAATETTTDTETK
ncbi:hypothetical protein D3C85_495700 [compost metagenome]